nr:MAG TPA: hypothetical protein [Caudoviricetes sp.]
MKKCKWAGDPNDEYCKSCDGLNMVVDDKTITCDNCAGYEEGEETEEFMSIPESEEDEVPFKEEDEPVVTKKETVKNKPKTASTKKTNNNTAKQPESEIGSKNKETINKKDDKAVKVKEEKKVVETSDGIKVVSMRYTSGATIKKGDNYFKFVAEEEWDTSQLANEDMANASEQLWVKLNGEVDRQIEELNNMN